MTELIVALDVPTALEARGLFRRLVYETDVRWFKVGARLVFTLGFTELCEEIAETRHLFVDFKLYQPVDTIAADARAAFDIGATFLTVHATPRMLEAAMRAKTRDDQRVLAVPYLTDASYKDGILDDCGDALRACDGIVCPVLAVPTFRSPRGARLTMADGKIIVCPGIRRRSPFYTTGIDDPGNNHVNPATPAEARAASADFIVVGRPIVGAPNPVAAARAFIAELGEQ